jgi:hypothetical protein
VPGTQYRLANGNFWEVFEGSSVTLAASNSLATNGVRPTGLSPIAVSWDGNVDANDASGKNCSAGCFVSSTNYVGFSAVSDSGNILMSVGTDLQSTTANYRVGIAYKYGQVSAVV